MTKHLSRRYFFRLGGIGCIGLMTAPMTAALTLLTPKKAHAYNHEHAHKRINQLSLKAFIQKVKNDPWGKHKEYELYEFKPVDPKPDDPKAKGFPDIRGFTVQAPGDTEVQEHLVELSLEDWIREGGFTADEPEVLSSLRHFYDPLAVQKDPKTGKRVHYLTDFLDPWVKAVAAWWFKLGEARMDAREWAITGPARHPYSENRYSYKKGLWYMRRAFEADTDKMKHQLFAAAWRSLGESMHLVADMTVPAHVRNDAHPYAWNFTGAKMDPYENYLVENEPTAGDVILECSKSPLDGGMASMLESQQDIWDLYHQVAKFTNANFFSADTMYGKDPDTGKMIKPANEMAPYPSPRLDDCKSDGVGYYEYKGRVVGHADWAQNTWWNSRNTVKQRLWNLVGMKNKSVSYLEVCRDQGRTLIPLAVAATGKLLEWFLPRVEVEIYDFTMVGGQLKGAVIHTPHAQYADPDLCEDTEPMRFNKGPKDWSQLRVNGVPYWETSGSYELEIKDGIIECTLSDKVKLKGPGQNQFDLMLYFGGFWVHSKQVMPEALSLPYMRVDGFEGETFSMNAGTSGVTMPKQPEYVVDFGDGSKPLVGTSPGGSHVYSKSGQYLATVMLYDKKTGKLVAGGYTMVTVNQAGLSDGEKAQIRKQQQMMNSQYGQMPSGPVTAPPPESMPSTTITVEETIENEIQKLRDAGLSEEEIAKVRKQMELMYKQMNPDAYRPKP